MNSTEQRRPVARAPKGVHGTCRNNGADGDAGYDPARPATLQLAEGYVQVAARGPVAVKGLADPVEIYALTGASAQRSRLHAAATRGLTREGDELTAPVLRECERPPELLDLGVSADESCITAWPSSA